jgi:hypothetical protein
MNEIEIKKIPYLGKYDNWELVEKMMNELDLTITSEKKHYDNQICKPSDKIVSFYRNDNPTKIFINVRLKHIKSGNSRGLSENDRKQIYNRQSEIQKKMQPKGKIIYNNFEMTRVNNLFKFLDEFEIQHLLEFRLNDIAVISKISKYTNLYSACQIKTAVIGDNNKANLNITYSDMLKYIQNGESLILITVNKDETLNSFWFLYDKYKLEKMINETNCSNINFTSCPNTVRKTNEKIIHMVFMNQFKYKITQIYDFKIEFSKWYEKSRKLPLDYWNHNIEQIPCFEHQMENSTNLLILSIIDDSELVTFINYNQIDVIINGCRIQNKIMSEKNSFIIRPYSKRSNVDEHNIYDVNVIDAFICFKSNSKDKIESIKKENYYECYVIPTRKNGKSNLDVTKNRFFVNTHKKIGNDIKLFNLKNHLEIINFKTYLEDCKTRKYIET